MYLSVKIPSLTTYAIYTDNTAVKSACCFQQSEIMSYRLWRHKFSSHFCAVIRYCIFAFLSGRVHFRCRFFSNKSCKPYFTNSNLCHLDRRIMNMYDNLTNAHVTLLRQYINNKTNICKLHTFYMYLNLLVMIKKEQLISCSGKKNKNMW